MKIEVYNDNFQNFKRYNIPKALMSLMERHPEWFDRKSTSSGFMIYWGLKLSEDNDHDFDVETQYCPTCGCCIDGGAD